MAYTQLASKLAYVGGNPNQPRKPYTSAQGQRQDKANQGVMAPMQPVNQPGVATAPKAQAPKTYVVAPPMPQPAIPQAAPQQPPLMVENAGSMPPPTGGFNPATATQAPNWWTQVPGYDKGWQEKTPLIQQAVSQLNPSLLPTTKGNGISQPLPPAYADMIRQGIEYLRSQQGQQPPGTPPGTPPTPPLPIPGWGSNGQGTEFWPLELGGDTEASRQMRNQYNQWFELFGGAGDVPSEVRLGLLNMLMNQQDRTAALGDRDTAVNTLQGAQAGANNPLGQAIQGNALQSLQSAYDPRYGELVMTGAREDANRRINQARTAMMDEYGDRGLGGSEVAGSMLNADIENRGIRDQALRELEIQLMEQQRGQQSNALQGAMGAYGMGQDVDWRARQGIADLYAGTVRNPIDLSGLIGLKSAIKRPVPQMDSSGGGMDWGGILSSLSPLANFIPGAGPFLSTALSAGGGILSQYKR